MSTGEVTIVTFAPQMTDEEKERGMAAIKTTFNVAKNCFKVGKFAFSIISGDLTAIVGVGSLISGIKDDFKPDTPDPVLEKLKELEEKLEKLSDAMTNHFNDLKAFVVELAFYTDLAEVASTLNKFMLDTLTSPGPTSKAIFKKQIEKFSPLEFAYRIISRLEQDSTNPLKAAMKGDTMQTKTTFNKWKNIIDGVLGDFLFLETFANGMFHNKDMYGPKKLVDKILNFYEKVNDWELEYRKNDRHFWPEPVRNMVHEVQDKNKDKSFEEKGDIIQKALEDILTDDIFYVVINRPLPVGGSFAYQAEYSQKPDQLITSYSRSGCTVLVYRSQEAFSAEKEHLKYIENSVEGLRNIEQYGPFTVPHLKELTKWKLDRSGFIYSTTPTVPVVVRSTKTDLYPYGPGWWINSRTTHPTYGVYFFIIAGYR